MVMQHIPSMYLATDGNSRKQGQYKIGSAFRKAESAKKASDQRRKDNMNADNSHNKPYTVDAIDMYALTNRSDSILIDYERCPNPKTSTESESLSWLRSFEKKVVHPAFEANYNRLNDKTKKDSGDPEDIQGIGSEWFELHDPDYVIDISAEEQRDKASKIFREIIHQIVLGTGKPIIELEYFQEKYLRKCIKDIINFIEDGANLTNTWRAVHMLCPRFGKTIFYLYMFKLLNELFGTQVMILPAYMLSVFSSFKNEIVTYADFQDMRFVERNEKWEEEIKEYLTARKLVVIGASLHIKTKNKKGEEIDESKEELDLSKFNFIRNLSNNHKFFVADEADFGTHVKRSCEIIHYMENSEIDEVNENVEGNIKTPMVSINTSGTNIARLAMGMSGHTVNNVEAVDYLEKVLVMKGIHPDFDDNNIDQLSSDTIPGFLESDKEFVIRHRDNPTKRDQNIVSKIVFEAKISSEWVINVINASTQGGWRKEEQPNMAKLHQDDHNVSGLEAIISAQFNKPSATSPKAEYAMNIERATRRPVKCALVSVQCGTKTSLNNVKQAYKRAITEYLIIALSGDFTTNREAEQFTKRKMNEAKKQGKKGIIILSMGMGFRSYSISQLTHVIHMKDGGDIDNIDQSGSRGATPGSDWDGNIKKEFCEMFFSFNSTRTDTIFHQLVYSQLVSLKVRLNPNNNKDNDKKIEQLFWDCMSVNRLDENFRWDEIDRDGQIRLLAELKSVDNLVALGAANMALDIIDDVDFMQKLVNRLGQGSSTRNKVVKSLFNKARTRKVGQHKNSKNVDNVTEKEQAEFITAKKEAFEKLLRLTFDIAIHHFSIVNSIPETFSEAMTTIILANEEDEWEEELGVSLHELSSFINNRKASELFDAVMTSKIRSEEGKNMRKLI